MAHGMAADRATTASTLSAPIVLTNVMSTRMASSTPPPSISAGLQEAAEADKY